jgi:hypothetical protein
MGFWGEIDTVIPTFLSRTAVNSLSVPALDRVFLHVLYYEKLRTEQIDFLNNAVVNIAIFDYLYKR